MDEMHAQNIELQRQVQNIHRQLKLAESLMGEDKQTQTEFDSE